MVEQNKSPPLGDKQRDREILILKELIRDFEQEEPSDIRDGLTVAVVGGVGFPLLTYALPFTGLGSAFGALFGFAWSPDGETVEEERRIVRRGKLITSTAMALGLAADSICGVGLLGEKIKNTIDKVTASAPRQASGSARPSHLKPVHASVHAAL